MRGGERVVEALSELYPDADIYTHVYDPSILSEQLRRQHIQSTFIQQLPDAIRRYRSYLPLMPLALEQLDLRQYDIVISSESGPAKGIITLPHTLHVCYCHTVMRYLWDMYHEYRESAGKLTRLLMPLGAHYLRLWDFASAARVDSFIANSENVAARIRKTYRRDATVINPPVDVKRFRADRPRENFYLTVSQLVSYKRVALIVEAFSKLGLPLVVIGEGTELAELRRRAAPNVRFLGRQPDEVVTDYLERCKAFVFAANEDFGIVPVEAQAAGAPVIAYGNGGVTETIIPGVTGLFFKDQTSESLAEVVRYFESGGLTTEATQMRRRAEGFSRERFLREFRTFMEMKWEEHCSHNRNR
jgi:glycosyltransferase involved in cell wall biosynthesis